MTLDAYRSACRFGPLLSPASTFLNPAVSITSIQTQDTTSARQHVRQRSRESGRHPRKNTRPMIPPKKNGGGFLPGENKMRRRRRRKGKKKSCSSFRQCSHAATYAFASSDPFASNAASCFVACARCCTPAASCPAASNRVYGEARGHISSSVRTILPFGLSLV